LSTIKRSIVRDALAPHRDPSSFLCPGLVCFCHYPEFWLELNPDSHYITEVTEQPQSVCFILVTESSYKNLPFFPVRIKCPVDLNFPPRTCPLLILYFDHGRQQAAPSSRAQSSPPSSVNDVLEFSTVPTYCPIPAAFLTFYPPTTPLSPAFGHGPAFASCRRICIHVSTPQLSRALRNSTTTTTVPTLSAFPIRSF
jgi:hypothetical protein